MGGRFDIQKELDDVGGMAFWNGCRVLITGAGGFIGSHLVETLLLCKAQVRALVKYNSRNDPGLLSLLPLSSIKDQLEIIPTDLLDLAALKAAMQSVTHVFHLGAIISVPYSYVHPAEVIQTNVIGTLNVLQAARDLGVKRVIHTSSSEVYGTALHVPISEEHPLQGQSPYAASKIGADKIAESFFCTYGLPIVILRPFNTYGPRQSARAVIPAIISQALTGNDIRLGNVDARRDLTYVSDTVAGFLAAGQTPGIEGKTFNLGTGTDIRISDLVHEIASLIDRPIEIKIDSSRVRPAKSEVQRLVSANHRAIEQLKWRPKVGIRQGLRKTIQWIADHLDHYRPDRYQI
jgi:dTDP-glucose 4,6-dehydratase